jgi:hypothetical protein
VEHHSRPSGEIRPPPPPTAPPPTTIRLERPQELPTEFAAGYLHKFLLTVPHTTPLTGTELAALKQRTSSRDCGAILHPAVIKAACDLHNVTTELYAHAPYFSPDLQQHITLDQTDFSSPLAQNPENTGRAIGALSSDDHRLPQEMEQAFSRMADGGFTLIVLHGTLPTELLSVQTEFPPTYLELITAKIFPQTHAELLAGRQGYTRAPSARTQDCTYLMQYGEAPPPKDLLRHPELRDLVDRTTSQETEHAKQRICRGGGPTRSRPTMAV